MTILEDIVAYKKKEIAVLKDRTPIRQLEQRKLFKRRPLSLKASILNPDKTGIIAEFKRKSPSRGIINEESTLEEVTTGYFRSGAAGLSILTDYTYFGGSSVDLERARELNMIPILRKDFVLDEYQVLEAKSLGADAILLIAAILDEIQIRKLSKLAHSLDLEVLFEIHCREELGSLSEHVDIIGVNNRDLHTFSVDIELSIELAREIPAGMVRISESGITSVLTIKRLKSAGYHGFLIGENFMRTMDPVVSFSDFVKLLMADYDKD